MILRSNLLLIACKKRTCNKSYGFFDGVRDSFLIFARRFGYYLLLRRAKIFGHRSQNNSLGCFVHCVRIPVCILAKQKRNAFWRPVLLWRRERDSNPRVLAHKLISSHRALIPFSTSSCLLLPKFRPFPPCFQDFLSKSPQN